MSHPRHRATPQPGALLSRRHLLGAGGLAVTALGAAPFFGRPAACRCDHRTLPAVQPRFLLPYAGRRSQRRPDAYGGLPHVHAHAPRAAAIRLPAHQRDRLQPLGNGVRHGHGGRPDLEADRRPCRRSARPWPRRASTHPAGWDRCSPAPPTAPSAWSTTDRGSPSSGRRHRSSLPARSPCSRPGSPTTPATDFTGATR